MATIYTPSSDTYLGFWSEYAKKPVDWANMAPRDRSDFRERIRRETLIGKLTFFHENIESYIFRQGKAYTTTRVFIHWIAIYLTTVKLLWITWRVSVMLYRRIKDQINGKEDLLYSLYYDWQYDDWHRDIEDMKMVNFRYNDHRDRDPSVSFWTHEIYKPEAEKAKSALKFYRYGNDSKLKWFFNKYF